MTGALRLAVTTGCAENFTAHLAETAAAVLVELDQGATAARILGAAGRLASGQPRSAAEESQVTAATARLHTALGPRRHEEESALGLGLTPDEVLALLTDTAEDLSGS